MEAPTRPTRSQQTLLTYIDSFVKEHGYGPSYREIMQALGYKSVSTVAVHVGGLLAKGMVSKHGRSARSLSVVATQTPAPPAPNSREEDWLITRINRYAAAPMPDKTVLQALVTTCTALRLQRAEAAARSHLG